MMKGRMQAEDDQFMAQLRAAFPPVAIDAGEALDSWGRTYMDAAEYRKQLAGKRWDELDREYLDLRSDVLGFLGTSHLVAVLPAYLHQFVAGGAFSQVPDMLLLMLTPPGMGRNGTQLGQKRLDALVEALTAAQRAAVATALRAFAKRYAGTVYEPDAMVALDGLWSQFEKGED